LCAGADANLRQLAWNRPISTSLADDIEINVTKLHANTSPYKSKRSLSLIATSSHQTFCTGQDLINEDNTLNLDFIRNEISDGTLLVITIHSISGVFK
jgi:hypothetical protein